MVKLAREMVNTISSGPKNLYNLASRSKDLIGKAVTNIKDSYHMSLGVDMGTCNTLISVTGKCVVLNEPSVIPLRIKAMPLAVPPMQCSVRPRNHWLR